MSNAEKITTLRNEVANCTTAIKAWKMGCKHLSPGGLDEAPSVKWIEMQLRVCVRMLSEIRAAQ